jgi:integrase
VGGKGKADTAWLDTGSYSSHTRLGAVQDSLGHADLGMTALYAHVMDMAEKNPGLFIPVKVG